MAAASSQTEEVFTYKWMHKEQPTELKIAYLQADQIPDVQRTAMRIQASCKGCAIVYINCAETKALLLMTKNHIYAANEQQGLYEDEAGRKTIVKVMDFAFLIFGAEGVEPHEDALANFDTLTAGRQRYGLQAIHFNEMPQQKEAE